MTNPAPTAVPRDDVFAREIRPLLFPDGDDRNTDPVFVLLSGQPGSGVGRATGRLRAELGGDAAVLSAELLRPFHPRFAEASASGSMESSRELSEATAEWLRAGMRFAREHHRSLILEGSFANPATALGLVQRFRTDGFATRVVVVAARRAESLLSTVSGYLRAVEAGRAGGLVSREIHDQGFAGTGALAAAAEKSDAVDRVTVLDRVGAAAFDAVRTGVDRPFQGAAAALRAAQSQRLSSLESAQWLSELRRVTEFAATLRNVPRPVTEVLIDLHETALREIIPELPVPSGSRVVAAQEHRSASDLVTLRKLLVAERPVDATGPVVVPAGPEHGGPSR
ncbi:MULTISPECIES: zeta toxin family protein [unclassified Microbacterium]|uniref:zeta toxin family protein n=1 Tax=unclassified Microbacterium TaxID=2609290 RepID=UPI00214B7CC5|nr:MULTISPECIES: zeta toxin family protein [unclassified Microbacterium]MCR2811280.1 zeta toxin family protein [Microbacterium sp. zg.B185]WIM19438.1 zeta toxin family protein [Microbacterium sp. zg-B185]